MFHKDVDPKIAQALMEASNWEKAGFDVENVEEEQLAESTDSSEVVEEEQEVHACPLCLNELAEPISDEQIVEHLDNVLTIMDVIEESLANEDSDAEVVEEEYEDEYEEA